MLHMPVDMIHDRGRHATHFSQDEEEQRSLIPYLVKTEWEALFGRDSFSTRVTALLLDPLFPSGSARHCCFHFLFFSVQPTHQSQTNQITPMFVSIFFHYFCRIIWPGTHLLHSQLALHHWRNSQMSFTLRKRKRFKKTRLLFAWLSVPTVNLVLFWTHLRPEAYISMWCIVFASNWHTVDGGAHIMEDKRA